MFESVKSRLASTLQVNRRQILGSAAAAISATYAGTSSTAQEATPVTTPEWFGQEFLFVQTFASGSLVPSGQEGAQVEVTIIGTPTTIEAPGYTLTLSGHIGETIYFSDRPARVFGQTPTPIFLENLGFTPDNPPNAALVTRGDDGTPVVVVVELHDPVIDESSGTVTYQANVLSTYDGEGLRHVLEQDYSTEMPVEFGSGSLFIDDCPDEPYACYLPGKVCYQENIKVGTCWHSIYCSPCPDAVTQCNQKAPS
ncbi:MAG: hypothetical protein AB7G88_07740, partial [Thermomicrobiales bacterium]